MLKLLKKHSLLKYLLGASLLAIPIYPKFPFIDVPGTYVSVRLEDFLLLGLAVLVLVHWLPRIKEIFKDDLTRKIVIYLGVGLISIISGVFLTNTVAFHIGFLNWARRIEYFIPFFAGLTVLSEERKANLEFLVKILILILFIVFVYGAGQKYLSWPVIITQNSEYSKGVALRWVPGAHINSTFAGHYDLATFLVMVLPMVAVYAFSLKGKIAKTVLFLAFFAGLWLILNSISRISIVSYLVGVVISFAILKKFKEIAVVVAISLLFFSMSSDLRLRYERFFEAIKHKSNYILLVINKPVYAQDNLPERRIGAVEPTPTPVPTVQDVSTSIRVNVEWPRALRAFAKNPLVGTGYSSITLATDSDYLRLLGETGILGFVSFILIFVEIGFIFLRAIPKINKYPEVERVFLAGIIGSMPGILINAAFIDIFEASKFATLFWMMIGLSVFLVRNSNNEKINF